MRGMTSLVAAVAVGLVSLAASAVKVEVVKVHSDAMGKDVPLSVILPDAYGKDSGRQFPVVYALHGAGGSHENYTLPFMGVRGCADKYGDAIDEQGYRAYVREIASGGRFTHFLMCPNAMYCNIPSKVMTTTWDAVARPGVHVESWQRGVVEMHRRNAGAKDDIYAVWADECRKQGLSPWLSIRMNNCHAVEMVTNAQHSAFWLSHPELRRVPHSSSWVSAALDYAHPEVRAYMLGFIREALEQYDMDGLTGDKFHLSLISLTYHTTQLKKGQHYEHMA